MVTGWMSNYRHTKTGERAAYVADKMTNIFRNGVQLLIYIMNGLQQTRYITKTFQGI